MDDIIEFILELVLEGSLELSRSRKVPVVLRVLASAVIVFFLLVLIALFVTIVRECWRSGNTVAAIIAGLVGTAVLSGFTYYMWKEYKKMKTKDNQEETRG